MKRILERVEEEVTIESVVVEVRVLRHWREARMSPGDNLASLLIVSRNSRTPARTSRCVDLEKHESGQ